MRDVQPSGRTFEGGMPGTLVGQGFQDSGNKLTSNLIAKYKCLRWGIASLIMC